MNVAGIDYSTHAVDIVIVELDSSASPLWFRYKLRGQDAFDRTRSIPGDFPGRASFFWDSVVAVGIEDPRGQNAGALYRIQGAILGHIPRRLLVQPWLPSQWRKAVGMPGNSSKGLVKATAIEGAIKAWGTPIDWGPPIRMTYPGWIDEWPQDAWDAYCIALATQKAINTEVVS